jgi:hypothetical protein
MENYCVILRPQVSMHTMQRRVIRYYLRAKTAVQAMLIVSDDPEWQVIGVEPASMFPPKPRSERKASAHNLHVA